MRAVLAVVLLAGCFRAGSGTGSRSTRPGVMPMLSELPADPAKRDAILDSSSTVASPEQRKAMTAKERKTETATAAAILGGLFSKTQNVTLGTATVFDESALTPLPVPPWPPGSTDHPDHPGEGSRSLPRTRTARAPLASRSPPAGAVCKIAQIVRARRFLRRNGRPSDWPP